MCSRTSLDSTLTPEEADQVRRSIKKHKRDDGEQRLLDCPPHLADGMQEDHSPGTQPSFAAAVQGRTPKPPFYTGEGEDDYMDDLGISDILGDQDVVADGELCPIADIPWDSYKQSWLPWRRALIIKVLGKAFSFKVLEPRIRRLWNLDNGCELLDIDKGYLVARFYSQADYFKVLHGGPWIVLDHYLTLSKWKPNFKPGDTTVQSTLVWLRLPTLPLELFVESSLLGIGNAVGTAVKVDTITADMIKARYARVCVELNLQGPLPPNVLVWGRKQPIEYEGLHHICFLCGRYGHKKEHCSGAQPSSDSPGPAPSAPPPQPSGGTADQPFGPWMLPAHVRRKHQLQQTRMNRRAQPSAANLRLNQQIQEQLRTTRPINPPRKFQSDPKADGSPHSVPRPHPANRGVQPLSDQSRSSLGIPGSASPAAHNPFTVLAELVEDTGPDDITILKEKIRALSGQFQDGLHEKAVIKLERGRHQARGPKGASVKSGGPPGMAKNKGPAVSSGPRSLPALQPAPSLSKGPFKGNGAGPGPKSSKQPTSVLQSADIGINMEIERPLLPLSVPGSSVETHMEDRDPPDPHVVISHV